MLLLLAVTQVHGQYSQSGSPGSPNLRVVPLTIKIVFLGLSSSDLNSSYLTSGIDSIPLKYQTILEGPVNTGVLFNFTYQTVYSDSSLTTKFAQFLSSIAITQNSTPGPDQPPPALNNPYFSNATTQVGTVQNYYYDASKVENWLASNQTLFGSVPMPGYTLFIADLHNSGIPSFTYSQYQAYTAKCISCSRTTAQAHYYNRTVTDPDLGQVLHRHYMTGWGGSERLSYIDLSAGPSYWTNELPVQVAAGARGVNLSSPYGKLWSAEFIHDYIVGAVYNLFGADQLYPVTYSQKYVFQLFVVDNRTAREKAQGPKLANTISPSLIRTQLAGLVPFANVTVNVKFANVTDYPSLAAVVANATTKIKDPTLSIPIVDARPVYNWLSTYGLGHIKQFINATRPNFSEYDIPVFLFAFHGNYTFAFTFKEDVSLSESPRSIGGVALGDLVLIDQSNSTLNGGNDPMVRQPGKGTGFTHPAIHELGHMLGLNHPFIYDLTQDFTNSVMGYYPYSNSFSQFDKDTILRGINDELLILAQATLASTGSGLLNAGNIAAARQEMAVAEQKYASMDYAGAVQYSLAAAQNALRAQANGALFSFFSPLIFGFVGLAAGVGLGLLAGHFLLRRRTPSGVKYNLCPTCQQPVKWDPAQMRWYCDHCQKPV